MQSLAGGEGPLHLCPCHEASRARPSLAQPTKAAPSRLLFLSRAWQGGRVRWGLTQVHLSLAAAPAS